MIGDCGKRVLHYKYEAERDRQTYMGARCRSIALLLKSCHYRAPWLEYGERSRFSGRHIVRRL